MALSLIHPYGKIKQFGPEIFTLDGEWKKSPFKRRMTIIRVGQELLIHNAINMSVGDYAALDDLGKVAWIVVPNKFHSSEAHNYQLRYPQAKLLVSRAAVAEVLKKNPHASIYAEMTPAWLQDEFPKLMQGKIEGIVFEGLRMLGEVVLFHKESQTLVVTDLVFNMQEDRSGFQKKMFEFNKIYKRFGPSKIFKWVFLNDKPKALASYQKMMQWNFNSVIMSHGTPVSHGGKMIMKAGFNYIFPNQT
jgi:hypothetical protein